MQRSQRSTHHRMNIVAKFQTTHCNGTDKKGKT